RRGRAQIPAQRVEQYVALHTQPRALASALNWYRAGGLLDGPTVPSVSVPTTYVWSDGDDAVSRYGAERTVDHVTGSYRFVTLKGVSHWQPEQAPEEISDAILNQVSQNR
ncbi:alpha/beta fold hydrolase, partial [Streptomyces anulatus]